MTILTISIDGERVELHGTTKGDPTQRAAVTRPWVWSRTATAWVLPRSLRPETRDGAVRRTQRALQDAGYVVEVEDSGHRLTVAEEREARTARLGRRADRHERRADRRRQESDAAYEASRKAVEHIPFGQPILVGHHSERGHRRDLARAHAAMDRSCQTAAEAREADRLAASLRAALDRGTPLVTLRNRIDRLEAEIRRYQRAGRADLLARAEEELDADRAELAHREEQGEKVWRPADFKPGDRVRYRFGVREVVRVNPKTLSVRTEYSWLDKLPYQEVTGRIAAEEWNAATVEAAEPAPTHDVVPADGNSSALQTTCQVPSCGERAYWRIGAAAWEHAPEDAASATARG